MKNVSRNRETFFQNARRNYQLHMLMVLPVVYIVTFAYVPMYGAQIAFKDFVASKGIFGSPWIGLDNFIYFFDSYQFWRLIRNTIGISLYSILAGFPIPIVLALSLNNSLNLRFKKTVQLVTYAPHFISTVVMVGMIIQFTSPTVGIYRSIVEFLHLEPISFLGESRYFWHIYVWTGVWQSMGWGTIIYMAALSGVDPQLHEAAIIDGAGKLQRTLLIDLPAILPTAIIILILSSGNIMNVGFEKIFLMQNDMNISASEVIQTYVYKVGLTGFPDFSYSAAIGLFNSLVNCLILIIVNAVSKKVSQTSLW